MLIRLCGHFINNPNHIDKLIAIKGLPEDWIFRPSKFGGKELLHPWEPDVDVNIPKQIRDLCEPTEVTFVFPPIEKGRDPVVDKRTILGLRFNFMSQPGQELWEKIELYMDRMTPRDQKVPEPVIVAPNHKSDFNPHAARKTVRGSIEFYSSDVPFVDLRQTPAVTTSVTVSTVNVPETPSSQTQVTQPKASFDCKTCGKVFDKERALRMHTMTKHKKEIVGV